MNDPKDYVDDSEKLGRFIFSSKEFSLVNKRVKYSAFLPARDLKASVYRIDGYTEEQIAALDKEFVSGKRRDGKVSKARADIFAHQIRKSGLKVHPETTPHKDHADIEGFTGIKSADLLKAIELADCAVLIAQ